MKRDEGFLQAYAILSVLSQNVLCEIVCLCRFERKEKLVKVTCEKRQRSTNERVVFAKTTQNLAAAKERANLCPITTGLHLTTPDHIHDLQL